MDKVFQIRNDYKSSWLFLDGERFFPCTQEHIRQLWARWLYPFHVDVARDIREYIIERMDHVKHLWESQNLTMDEWQDGADVREYKKLEGNFVLLTTLIERSNK